MPMDIYKHSVTIYYVRRYVFISVFMASLSSLDKLRVCPEPVEGLRDKVAGRGYSPHRIVSPLEVKLGRAFLLNGLIGAWTGEI
jgi:hypothetical protein